MNKLNNKKGSTMLVTMLLMALFSILLVGFHTAVISMTARLDTTYSQKQTYLYSRSAVTALADELMSLSESYDDAWDDYVYRLENPTDGEEPVRPIKPSLLEAVDKLTVESPTLVLEDCNFSDPMVDGYDKLDMDITRVIETGEDGSDVLAYKLTATTVIDGIKKVSDSVSILLSTSEEKFEVGQEGAGSGGGSGSSKSGFSGIYTDQQIIFNSGSGLFNGTGPDTIVNGDMVDETVYNMYKGIEGVAGKTKIMNEMDMTLRYLSGDFVISDTDFYINGDLNLLNLHNSIEIKNCNFYVNGTMTIDTPTQKNVDLSNIKVYCTDFVNKANPDKLTENNVEVNEYYDVSEYMNKIPSRPRPSWVDEALSKTPIDYSVKKMNGGEVMEAGGVYKLADGFNRYDLGIKNGAIGDATEAEPITILVSAGQEVGLLDKCGPNVRFIVATGGKLYIRSTGIQVDVYGEKTESSNPAETIIDNGVDNFSGTIIIPKLQVLNNQCAFVGGSNQTPPSPEIDKEEIKYYIYTNYIYTRR